MTQQNTLDQTVLASLLEPLEDSEGILVCGDEVPYRDEDSTKRLFGAFQFFGIDGLDGGQHYRYAGSGVVICHTGPSVNVLIGGDVTEAIPDLMRALDQLGWQNVDVYSTHGQAFFDDLAKHMPASVHLDVSLREIPAELSDDLQDFARQAFAATGGAGEASVEEKFMSMLRSESSLSPSPAPNFAVAPSVQKETVNPGMGLAVGVSHNFVPEDDPADLSPTVPLPIPPTEKPPVNPTPFAAQEKPKAAMARPVIPLATASPVAAPQSQLQVESVAMLADPVPTSESETNAVALEPARSVVEQAIPAVRTAAMKQEVQLPFPAPAPTLNARRDFESLVISPDFPDAPITLGDSLVVVCLPKRGYSDADLQELAGDRDIVIFEPGAVNGSNRHVGWDMIDEQAGVDLVAALWPNEKQDHLAVHAMFALARHQPAPRSLSSLLTLATQDIESAIFPQLEAAEIDPQIVDYLHMQHRLGLLDVSLWRMVVDLWSAARLEESQQAAVRVSFSALAGRRVKPLLVLVKLDALDSGSASEFLAAGALRWVSRLAISQRTTTTFGAAVPVTEKEQLAASLASLMTPELLSILHKLVNSKS